MSHRRRLFAVTSCFALALLALPCLGQGPIRNYFKNRLNRSSVVQAAPAQVPVIAPVSTPVPVVRTAPDQVSTPAVCLDGTCQVVRTQVAVMPPSRVVTWETDTPFSETAAAEKLSRSRIRPALLMAIRQARDAKEITRLQAVQLRVASFSPAFLEKVEQLAITQMAFSGGEVPLTEAQTIDKVSIDWNGLAEFLERVLPLILDMLKAFGILG